MFASLHILLEHYLQHNFVSLVPRYYVLSPLRTFNLSPRVSAMAGVDFISF